MFLAYRNPGTRLVARRRLGVLKRRKSRSVRPFDAPAHNGLLRVTLLVAELFVAPTAGATNLEASLRMTEFSCFIESRCDAGGENARGPLQ